MIASTTWNECFAWIVMLSRSSCGDIRPPDTSMESFISTKIWHSFQWTNYKHYPETKFVVRHCQCLTSIFVYNWLSYTAPPSVLTRCTSLHFWQSLASLLWTISCHSWENACWSAETWGAKYQKVWYEETQCVEGGAGPPNFIQMLQSALLTLYLKVR